MTQQMANTQLMMQIVTLIVVLIFVTCLMFPIIRRKTDRVALWTLFCLIPFFNTIAYMLILSKTDKDVLARLSALEAAQKRS